MISTKMICKKKASLYEQEANKQCASENASEQTSLTLSFV